MFKVINIITALLVCILFLTDTGFTSSEKMNVAVFEFDVKGDIGKEDAGAIIAEWMVNALHKANAYNLRERVLLKKVLDEQELGMTGRIDDATASKIGEIYGVQAIITGSVIKWETIIYVTARLINTENGAILKATEVKTNNINDIRNKIDELASIIISTDDTEEKKKASSDNEIDVNVDIAMDRFYRNVTGARDFVALTQGMLIVPNVVKGGLIIGYEYGLGALRIDGMTVDYYKLTAGSIGLQIGVQKKDIIIGFMTDEALKKFRDNPRFKLGIDANLILKSSDKGDSIDTTTIEDPVVALVFDVSGLILDLSLKGLKFTKIDKPKGQ
jgi:lipid-binding SYLF domain-containing protein